MTVRGACAECSRGAHCVGSAARAQGPPAAADAALLLFAAGHPGAWMYTRRSPLAWDVQSPGCSAQMSRHYERTPTPRGSFGLIAKTNQTRILWAARKEAPTAYAAKERKLGVKALLGRSPKQLQ